MPADDINPVKNRRPLRTQRMRNEGWQGIPLSIPVSLIFKSDQSPGGRPSKQPVERELDNAIALSYVGLFTMLQARDRRDHGRPAEPQAVRDISIAASIKVPWGLPYRHDRLMKLGEEAIRTDPRYSSVKEFRDAYRSIGAQPLSSAEARNAEDASIVEQLRILDLLCKAAERSRRNFKGWREARTNGGRHGEARSDIKPSALERSILLTPAQQERLALSLEDMCDVAINAWVNPALLCLDHYLLFPVFEVVICASRNRAGLPGEITRFGALAFVMFLMGQIDEFAAGKKMSDVCVNLYTTALLEFNARWKLDIQILKDTLLHHIDAALAGGGVFEEIIVLGPALSMIRS